MGDVRHLGSPVFPYYKAKEALTFLLSYIGEDPNREGLKETPDRVLRSYGELFCGYSIKEEDIFKTFDGEHYDEMVLLKGAEFWSSCEHHLLPFFGTACIAYIPEKNGKIIGISKLGRLLDVYSKRLQVQERLTSQITAALDKHLQPLGSACVIEASHLCMVCRGVRKQHSTMVTSSLTGAFRQPEVRAEFFSMIRK